MRLILLSMIACFGVLSAKADLELRDAWSRATPPGMPMGAVYGEFVNTGSDPIEVLSVRTELARGAEIHESVEIEGMMRMREVTPFIVGGGKTIALEPGGKHIMLMGLKSALVSGSKYSIVVETSLGEKSEDVIVGGFGQMSAPKMQ